MAGVFPQLKTGAIAQYPVTRELNRPTSAMRFLDMGRQVYADATGALRRWQLRLSHLDESEAARLTEFFTEMRGSLGRFDFEDPMTGEVVTNCRFDEDELVLSANEEFDSRMTLTVAETR